MIGFISHKHDRATEHIKQTGTDTSDSPKNLPTRFEEFSVNNSRQLTLFGAPIFAYLRSWPSPAAAAFLQDSGRYVDHLSHSIRKKKQNNYIKKINVCRSSTDFRQDDVRNTTKCFT
jgi:hypothetical protein